MQGLSTGAGIVVSRAIIRDMFAPSQAQKVMSQVTIFFGVAPAIAPIVGGWMLVHVSWHGIFWFLAGVGISLWLAIFRLLPETLHTTQRQSIPCQKFAGRLLAAGVGPALLLLALASGIPFNGMFLYVLSAPVFLGEHLGLAAPAVLLVFYSRPSAASWAVPWSAGAWLAN
jgi:DHA1 family bicyclomycin/chloramphenicol resistance-like MFS transporter